MTEFLIVAGTFIAMEGVATLVHRHVMHGFGWGWHASHHRPRRGRFERNDLYALVFAAIAIALVWSGTRGAWPLQWIGAGMTLYGAAYFLVHDGLVHRRWPVGEGPRRQYLRRLVQAHRLHHALDGRDGGVSFGFLRVPSAATLQRQRDTVRARRRKGESRSPPAASCD